MGNKILTSLSDMFFTTPNELYENIEEVKVKYHNLEKEYKDIYKWYFFFQLCLLKDTKDNPIKSNLWDYINGIINKEVLEASYLQFVQSQKRIEIKNNNNLQLSMDL